MNTSIPTDSRSPPHTGGVTTRASTDAHDDTAQPSLMSGFREVIAKERALQSATQESLGQTGGPHSADLDRILLHQCSRLGANIALLEQRYEALSRPEQFVPGPNPAQPPGDARRMEPNKPGFLPALVVQHVRLLAEIDGLIASAPDGQRGELILTEVSRSHEEMAWMLTALLKDDESSARIMSERGAERADEAIRAQESWDNEGGPVRLNPPSG